MRGSAEQRHCVFVAQLPLVDNREKRGNGRSAQAGAGTGIGQIGQLSQIETKIRRNCQGIHGEYSIYGVFYLLIRTNVKDSYPSVLLKVRGASRPYQRSLFKYS